MKKLINIQGKWYILLGMFSGRYYVCNLFDINNELVYTGIIWYKQPFFYNNDVWYGGMFYKVVKLTRIIKQLIIGDVFGRRRLQAYLESRAASLPLPLITSNQPGSSSAGSDLKTGSLIFYNIQNTP